MFQNGKNKIILIEELSGIRLRLTAAGPEMERG